MAEIREIKWEDVPKIDNEFNIYSQVMADLVKKRPSKYRTFLLKKADKIDMKFLLSEIEHQKELKNLNYLFSLIKILKKCEKSN